MSKVDQSKGSATKDMVRGSIWQAQMFYMGLCSQLILATGNTTISAQQPSDSP